MDLQRLRRVLAEDGINPDAYSLAGGHPSERLVIACRMDGWTVYYSERGKESGRRVFETEDEACRYFLKLIRRDPTTRFHLVVGPLPAAEADAAFVTWKDTHGLATLSDDDVRIDNPPLQENGGRLRRYWVRGTLLTGR